MSRLARTLRIANLCERQGLSTREGMARVAEAAAKAAPRPTRRQVLSGMAGVAGLTAFGLPRGARAGQAQNIDVGIVGAGLAGLVCADQLRKAGITAKLYEANPRVGGRQFTLRNYFPGQVAELGGELVDNLHKTLIGYANEFGLTLEDMGKLPGDVFYHFDGAHVPESIIVDEYRDLVAAMRDDLQASTGVPTADYHNAGDVALDNMSLEEYLYTRGAGPAIYKAIEESYEAEYGLAIAQQSALNFLLFIHADSRSTFTPFGVYSDERYHIVEGSDAISQGIANRLAPGSLSLGHRLVQVAKTASGRIQLTFKIGNQTVTVTHDAVVLAIPFTVLRGVTLHASLGLPAWKTQAIQQLGYGTNAKRMVGFNGPHWAMLGSNGSSYSDLADHQATWETNPSLATSSNAILTDYASGARGASLSQSKLQAETHRFVQALDLVYPGALAAATKVGGNYRAVLQHWPSMPTSLGSYTCYTPGQFTTIAENEGKPVGNLFFAGEHANSFYVWQGFMEGAALSGIDAAAALLG
jgi:monoamine oxidase